MKVLFAAVIISAWFLVVPARCEVIFDLHDVKNSWLHMETSGTVVPSPLDPPWQFTFDEPTDQLIVRFENPLGLTFSTETLQIIGMSEQSVRTEMDISYFVSQCCNGSRGLAVIGQLQDQVFANGCDLRNTTNPRSWQQITTLSLLFTPDSSIPGSVTINNILLTGQVVPEPRALSILFSAIGVGLFGFCSQPSRRHRSLTSLSKGA